MKEVKILRTVSPQNENIVTLFGVFEDEDSVYLLLELCTGGELFDVIKEKGSFSEARTWRCRPFPRRPLPSKTFSPLCPLQHNAPPSACAPSLLARHEAHEHISLSFLLSVFIASSLPLPLPPSLSASSAFAFSISLSLPLSVSVSLSVSLSPSSSLSHSVSVSLCLSLHLCFSLSVCLSVCLSLSLSLSVCLFLSFSLSLPPSLPLSLSFSLVSVSLTAPTLAPSVPAAAAGGRGPHCPAGPAGDCRVPSQRHRASRPEARELPLHFPGVRHDKGHRLWPLRLLHPVHEVQRSRREPLLRRPRGDPSAAGPRAAESVVLVECSLGKHGSGVCSQAA